MCGGQSSLRLLVAEPEELPPEEPERVTVPELRLGVELVERVTVPLPPEEPERVTVPELRLGVVPVERVTVPLEPVGLVRRTVVPVDPVDRVTVDPVDPRTVEDAVDLVTPVPRSRAVDPDRVIVDPAREVLLTTSALLVPVTLATDPEERFTRSRCGESPVMVP